MINFNSIISAKSHKQICLYINGTNGEIYGRKNPLDASIDPINSHAVSLTLRKRNN